MFIFQNPFVNRETPQTSSGIFLLLAALSAFGALFLGSIVYAQVLSPTTCTAGTPCDVTMSGGTTLSANNGSWVGLVDRVSDPAFWNPISSCSQISDGQATVEVTGNRAGTTGSPILAGIFSSEEGCLNGWDDPSRTTNESFDTITFEPGGPVLSPTTCTAGTPCDITMSGGTTLSSYNGSWVGLVDVEDQNAFWTPISSCSQISDGQATVTVTGTQAGTTSIVRAGIFTSEEGCLNGWDDSSRLGGEVFDPITFEPSEPGGPVLSPTTCTAGTPCDITMSGGTTLSSYNGSWVGLVDREDETPFWTPISSCSQISDGQATVTVTGTRAGTTGSPVRAGIFSSEAGCLNGWDDSSRLGNEAFDTITFEPGGPVLSPTTCTAGTPCDITMSGGTTLSSYNGSWVGLVDVEDANRFWTPISSCTQISDGQATVTLTGNRAGTTDIVRAGIFTSEEGCLNGWDDSSRLGGEVFDPITFESNEPLLSPTTCTAGTPCDITMSGGTTLPAHNGSWVGLVDRVSDSAFWTPISSCSQISDGQATVTLTGNRAGTTGSPVLAGIFSSEEGCLNGWDDPSRLGGEVFDTITFEPSEPGGPVLSPTTCTAGTPCDITMSGGTTLPAYNGSWVGLVDREDETPFWTPISSCSQISDGQATVTVTGTRAGTTGSPVRAGIFSSEAGCLNGWDDSSRLGNEAFDTITFEAGGPGEPLLSPTTCTAGTPCDITMSGGTTLSSYNGSWVGLVDREDDPAFWTPISSCSQVSDGQATVTVTGTRAGTTGSPVRAGIFSSEEGCLNGWDDSSRLGNEAFDTITFEAGGPGEPLLSPTTCTAGTPCDITMSGGTTLSSYNGSWVGLVDREDDPAFWTPISSCSQVSDGQATVTVTGTQAGTTSIVRAGIFTSEEGCLNGWDDSSRLGGEVFDPITFEPSEPGGPVLSPTTCTAGTPCDITMSGGTTLSSYNGSWVGLVDREDDPAFWTPISSCSQVSDGQATVTVTGTRAGTTGSPVRAGIFSSEAGCLNGWDDSSRLGNEAFDTITFE